MPIYNHFQMPYKSLSKSLPHDCFLIIPLRAVERQLVGVILALLMKGGDIQMSTMCSVKTINDTLKLGFWDIEVIFEFVRYWT
jgi:hypothetical protein